ncbi:hypothetical protein Tsubulata_000048 [Turnera subulata]|uniref:Myb-like domain-containing protein n=1 Tax=Turnera subulata TaxID=218843 RepID=A0A9Q0J8Q6_9ROSI|nr:hypothetical protein Tsubulata_000048 [Turnera subulata]
MRSKTCVARPRYSVSPRKPSPTATTLRPIPTPNLDDDYEDYYDMDVDISDGIAVRDRKRRRLDCSNSDGVDWLDVVACIQCDKRGEELLVCSEIGCPVAFHERCVPVEVKFDDAGKFCCPYCWYKRKVAEMRELREKAKLAKKATLDFVNSGKDNVGKGCGRRVEGNDLHEEQLVGRRECSKYSNVDCGMESRVVQAEGEHERDGEGGKEAELDQGKVVPEVECHTEPVPATVDVCDRGTECVKDSISKGKENDVVSSKSNGVQILEDEQQMLGQNDEQVDDDHGEEIMEDKEEAECLNTQPVNEGSPTAPSEENQEMPVERVVSEAPETTVVSCRGKVARKEPSMVRRSPRHVGHSSKENPSRLQDAASPMKTSPKPQASKQRAGNQNKKVSPSKKSGMPGKALERMYTNFSNEKRKRVLWSSEEEEMLKKGVEIFSTTANKNIPWRKILEYGQEVFDTTRTPDDLRGKWKNCTKVGR